MKESRLKADKVGSGFIKDDELISYINSSYTDLYDLLVGAYGNDYYAKESDFSTIGATKRYSLPDDFYKLLGVDLLLGFNQTLTLKPYQLNERARYQQGTYWSALVGQFGPKYRLNANEIEFAPVPDGAYSIRLLYVPSCPRLENGEDELNGVNGWEEYIAVDVAMKMLEKEDTDVTTLQNRKLFLISRINLMAENRDAGQSFRVTDVTGMTEDSDELSDIRRF
jgi:hypothetical protein